MAAGALQPIQPTFYLLEGFHKDGAPIAGFDLDWTLVRSIRGKFPKDADDWAFLPNRLSVLAQYEADGYILVIFTNQGYKGARQQMALQRINRIIAAFHQVGLHPWVAVATGKDHYRKPEIGMWNFLQETLPSLDQSHSFYVGDAAGRPQDFDDNDRQFAQNAGLTFFVPEDIFPKTLIPNPHRIKKPAEPYRNLQPKDLNLPSTQNMLIFVGMPGTGKSTFYRTYLEPRGYLYANQDTLKTKAKVLNMVRNALATGKSVVVDATNPTLEVRREFLDLAIEYQVPTMILYWVTNGHGRNKLRGTELDPTAKPVPEIAYNIYYKKLVEPTFETDGVHVVQIDR